MERAKCDSLTSSQLDMEEHFVPMNITLDKGEVDDYNLFSFCVCLLLQIYRSLLLK